MDNTVQQLYGDRVRIRVCGLCWEGDKILLVNHKGLYGHDFWAPPGGGMEFGFSAESTLKKEFLEETGLEIEAGGFKFACEFIQPPFHAIELFFDTVITGGRLTVGEDPEMGQKDQIITELKYFSIPEINGLMPGHLHGLFKRAKTVEKIRDLTGYLKI